LRYKSVAYIAVALTSVLVVSAFGITQLFNQTFPSITSVTPGLASGCATLVAGSGIPTSVTGNPGFVGFGCGTNGAFAALNANVTGFAYTPSFTLPVPYDYLMVQSGSTTCNGGQALNITSGQGFVFPCGGGWYYFAHYADVPPSGLPSFQITWSG